MAMHCATHKIVRRGKILLPGLALLLFLLPGKNALGGTFALTQEISAQHGDKHVSLTGNAFFSGDRLRLETLDPATGRQEAQFLVLPSKGKAYRLDNKDICSPDDLSSALPRPLLEKRAGAFSSWNSLNGSTAQITPIPQEDDKTCKAYSINMGFMLRNFRANTSHGGNLSGKVWLCPDEGKEGNRLAVFDKFYRDSAQSLLNPLDYAVFDIGDLSSTWAVLPENASRLARDILDGLARLKGAPMRWELEWRLPAPPSRELRRTSFPAGRPTSLRARKVQVERFTGPAAAASDTMQTLSIHATRRFIGGSVAISRELFRLPAACAGELK